MKKRNKKTYLKEISIGSVIGFLLFLAGDFNLMPFLYKFNQSFSWLMIHSFNLSEFGLLMLVLIPLVYIGVGLLLGFLFAKIKRYYDIQK